MRTGVSRTLVLGPLLRWVGKTEATVWVETDGPCEVEVLGSTARTFCVEDHHYALVHVDGLEPGEVREYGVALDGEPAWPEPGSPYPPSVIRSLAEGEPFDIAFGSCRLSAPHEPPYTLTKDEHPDGRETDALIALVEQIRHRDPRERPRLLVLLGDQVYADSASPAVREFIRRRRDVSRPPGEEVADFEEYTRLYYEAWSDPPIRWLLSTVPSAMVFDDHDVHDDWNTSEAWVREMRAQPWWDERIAGAFMSYWLYQHLGNLAPVELAEDELWQRVQHEADAGPMLREFAIRADRTTDGSQWSYHRDIDGTRLVMIDTRAGRVLDEGRRSMVDAVEWRYIEEHARGGCDHLLLGTSLPLMLVGGMHHLEAWSEKVCAGAWGRLAAHAGERLRQTMDLEHWGAFRDSFERMCGVIADVGAGRRGAPPATIVALSGDVHHAYVAEAGFPREAGVESAVVQAVCSPFRNPLDAHERHAISFAASRPAERAGHLLARAAGVPAPPMRWRLAAGPVFDNQVATLSIDGRAARLRIERAIPGPALETTVERVLSAQR
jgi:hypothetical protein